MKQKKWAGALREVSAIRRRREFKVSRGVPAASGQSNRVGRRLPKGIRPADNRGIERREWRERLSSSESRRIRRKRGRPLEYLLDFRKR